MSANYMGSTGFMHFPGSIARANACDMHYLEMYTLAAGEFQINAFQR